MTVREACGAYLRDLEARNARKSTKANYRTLFKQLQAFVGEGGNGPLAELDTAALRAWREGWTCAYSSQRQRLAQLRAFFSYAVGEGWIEASPLAGVRMPKSDTRPTMPLSVDEVDALLAASHGMPREQALLLLLRYSGLAIGDAATLARSSVQFGGELVLRRAKSGELVTVLLPPQVLAALDAIERPGLQHYFWTGLSTPATVSKYWRARLHLVASLAGVKGFHPHRLRDTFAVELLLAGVSMQDVSTLLGHSSIRTTETYYAPWNQARRARLASLLIEVHRQDKLLLGFTPKKPAGAGATAPAGASLATHAEPTRLAQGST